jgi:hypothetical protein
MKKILFAFSMLVMTLPTFSFANEVVALPGAEETEVDLTADRRDDWRRPRWPRQEFTCVAQNRLRQRFAGRDWNLRQAQREALMQCQRRGFGRFLGCRLLGCRRTR